MRKHKITRYLLPGILSALLITGGFSCNLMGPHSASGPDTTSSNFTWTVDTIGGLESILYDRSVVNDTLPCAVGELFRKGSRGTS